MRSLSEEARSREVLFSEYIILLLKWFVVFLVEANLFQVFIKLQSDLIIRAIIIRRLNFKTKFKIETEAKSSIINIISIYTKTRHLGARPLKIL